MQLGKRLYATFVVLLLCLSYALGGNAKGTPSTIRFKGLEIVGRGDIRLGDLSSANWPSFQDKELPTPWNSQCTPLAAIGWTFHSFWVKEEEGWQEYGTRPFAAERDVYVRAVFTPNAHKVRRLDIREGEGRVELRDERGARIDLNATIFHDDIVTVECKPAPGYRLPSTSPYFTGLEYRGGDQYRVVGDVKISVSFLKHAFTYIGYTGDAHSTVSLRSPQNGRVPQGSELLMDEEVTLETRSSTGWRILPQNLVLYGLEALGDRYRVVGDVEIEFKSTPIDYHVLTLPESQHGTIALQDSHGSPIGVGAVLHHGAAVQLSIRPHSGWELHADSLRIEGLQRKGDTYYVTGDISVAGAFYRKLFRVQKLHVVGCGAVRISRTTGEQLGVNSIVRLGEWVYIDLQEEGLESKSLKGVEQVDGRLYRVTGSVRVEALYLCENRRQKSHPLLISHLGEGDIFVTLPGRDTVRNGGRIPINTPFSLRVKPAKGHTILKRNVLISGVKRLSAREYSAIGPVEIRAYFVPKPTTSLEQPKRDVRLYPNPASRILRVECDSPIRQYAIRSLDGHTILQGQEQGNTLQIHVESLLPGVYILETQFQEGERQTQRFIRE